jgi:hypothetical protein
MTIEDDTTVDDAALEAELESGFTDKPARPPEKPAVKPDAPDPAAAAVVEKPAAPKYVRVKETDWAEVRAAAAKSASHDQQLSRLFGTTGKLQEQFKTVQAGNTAPRSGKIEISKAAFAEMEKDFPELAAQVHKAMEGALAGVSGGAGQVDAAMIETMLGELTVKRAIEALEQEHPDWRVITGSVNAKAGEKPDPNNPYRKWLATKPESYQKRINNTWSAELLGDAIELFKAESKAPPAPVPNPREAARRAAIASAVQPRGDGGNASPDDTLDANFASGFNS